MAIAQVVNQGMPNVVDWWNASLTQDFSRPDVGTNTSQPETLRQMAQYHIIIR